MLAVVGVILLIACANDQAVVVPSEATDRLGAAALKAGVYLVIGINERESTGSATTTRC